MKILIPVGCRSDSGLSAPIIKRLQTNPKFEVLTLQLKGGDFVRSVILTTEFLWQNNGIEYVFITGDRIEMLACANVCYFKGINIIHLGAGIVNEVVATCDEYSRHSITLMSNVQLCEDGESIRNVELLCGSIGKEDNAYLTGTTHLDDLEIDESLVPKEDYDLMLINPITKGESIPIKFKFPNKLIMIGANEDPKKYGWLDDILEFEKERYTYYGNLPRSQFFGLMKNCKRFITNSSCAQYEAPFFLEPERIIQIGDRNRKRSTPKNVNVKGSDKIVEVLEKYV